MKKNINIDINATVLFAGIGASLATATGIGFLSGYSFARLHKIDPLEEEVEEFEDVEDEEEESDDAEEEEKEEKKEQ